jgi:hypothetical protein
VNGQGKNGLEEEEEEEEEEGKEMEEEEGGTRRRRQWMEEDEVEEQEGEDGRDGGRVRGEGGWLRVAFAAMACTRSRDASRQAALHLFDILALVFPHLYLPSSCSSPSCTFPASSPPRLQLIRLKA